MSRTLLFLFVLGCSTPTATPECTDASECGDGEACLEEVCAAVDCLSSDSCGLDAHCDLELYTCVDGCEGTDDCAPGSTCTQGSCVLSACSDTHLDCPVGTVCDGGACAVDGSVCETCASSATCGDGRCATFRDQAGDEAFCYGHCDSSDDCAAGFSCTEFRFLVNGQPTPEKLCYADCNWLTEQGWL